MKRHTYRSPGEDLIYTASATTCSDCGRELPVYQSTLRYVQRLDDVVRVVRRDKRCGPGCPGTRPILYAPKDLRVALPGRIYGLDATLHVGERHLRDGVALGQIARDLNAHGLPLDPRHTGRVFRDFLALASLARGTEAELQARLRAQGGLVLMVDGVQFDDRAPVLYLAWDALSGTPLFGERRPFRGEDDLVPILERVRAMQVPVIGIVTDKEKGLVPAVTKVFPDAPYQFCHTHFLKNCAKPMQPDLHQLGASVARRAERVRELDKELSSLAPAPGASDPPAATGSEAPAALTAPTSPAPPAPAATPGPAAKDTPPSAPAPTPTAQAPALTEREFARAICDLVRANSRVSGKAPLDPPELERHDRLEQIRALVNEARGKKVLSTPSPRPGRSSINSPAR